MYNLMIDLETMGTVNNSAILQISAVYFDPKTNEIGEEFNCFIDLESCISSGLEVTASTIEWWMSQSDEARSNIISSKKITIKEALILFSEFYNGAKCWGNGASFDIGILRNAYLKNGINCPIHFWLERDCRTILDLMPKVKEQIKFEGTPHNGIDDCKYQIKYISKIIQLIS